MPLFWIPIIAFALFVIISLAISYIFSGVTLHSVRQPIVTTPKDYGLEYEDVEFESTDGLKLKGWFDKRKKLPEGYRIIKGTAEETLIELSDGDWSTREGARKDAQKLLGLYPAETFKVKHGFDDIIGEVIRDIHNRAKGLPPLPSQEKDE